MSDSKPEATFHPAPIVDRHDLLEARLALVEEKVRRLQEWQKVEEDYDDSISEDVEFLFGKYARPDCDCGCQP